jgi:hypothetical protein
VLLKREEDMPIQYSCEEQQFQRTLEASTVPHQGETVFFWDTGRFRVKSAEQRFEKAAWSHTGYDEVWHITLEPA